jgi:hypothetical protein
MIKVRYTPTLTLRHKGGGKAIAARLPSPSPSMGEGGVGVTHGTAIVEY